MVVGGGGGGWGSMINVPAVGLKQIYLNKGPNGEAANRYNDHDLNVRRKECRSVLLIANPCEDIAGCMQSLLTQLDDSTGTSI